MSSPLLPTYSVPLPFANNLNNKDVPQLPMATAQPGQPQVTYVMMQPAMQAAPAAVDIGSQYRNELYARCARGDHVSVTRYGPCGIITSIILFPLGLIALIFDSERRCERCGVPLGGSKIGCR